MIYPEGLADWCRAQATVLMKVIDTDAHQRLNEIAKALDANDERIKELEREIDVLRIYGNTDCTAMADEALKSQK